MCKKENENRKFIKYVIIELLVLVVVFVAILLLN